MSFFTNLKSSARKQSSDANPNGYLVYTHVFWSCSRFWLEFCKLDIQWSEQQGHGEDECLQRPIWELAIYGGDGLHSGVPSDDSWTFGIFRRNCAAELGIVAAQCRDWSCWFARCCCCQVHSCSNPSQASQPWWLWSSPQWTRDCLKSRKHLNWMTQI